MFLHCGGWPAMQKDWGEREKLDNTGRECVCVC